MNENVKFLLIKFFVLVLLFEGVIGILLLPFFSFSFLSNPKNINTIFALTIIPSADVVSISAPTNLTATVISSSQIDLSWSVVGEAISYKIYRDNIYIASSIVNSYSDTGLSPSTTYTYTVTAVDALGAESPQSDSVSDTTLAEVVPPEEKKGIPFLPPPAPEEPSLIINNGDAYTNSPDVVLSIFAKKAIQMAISNSPDFTDVAWEDYQTSKKWRLTEGEGEKTVYTKFRSSSGGVSEAVSDSIIFDITAPLNISNLEGIAGDQQIFLKWKSPPDKDFGGVRIMGSTDFYPSSPSEGTLVYQGAGETFLAVGLTNGVRYYYTAFAYDKAGNLSSGAVVSAVPFKETPPPPPPPPPPPAPPPSEIEKITPQDFDFQQEGKKIPPEEVEKKIKIKTEAGKPLAISLDYEKVPEVLKTIMVTLEKEGKSFSFLLRINSQKTRYEAVLLAPQEPGIYNLTIDILDYKNQTLKKIVGYLEVVKIEPSLPLLVSAPWYKDFRIWFFILLGIILIILIGYLVWWIKMKQLEKKC